MFYKPPPPHEPFGLWGDFFLQSFRENVDLEKAYMQGRFDAIPYIDESEVNFKTME